MISVVIGKNFADEKNYIKFCSDDTIFSIELEENHFCSIPFLGGYIPNDCLMEIVNFLIEEVNRIEK